MLRRLIKSGGESVDSERINIEGTSRMLVRRAACFDGRTGLTRKVRMMIVLLARQAMILRDSARLRADK